jgi:hypothetical protein
MDPVSVFMGCGIILSPSRSWFPEPCARPPRLGWSASEIVILQLGDAAAEKAPYCPTHRTKVTSSLSYRPVISQHPSVGKLIPVINDVIGKRFKDLHAIPIVAEHEPSEPHLGYEKGERS